MRELKRKFTKILSELNEFKKESQYSYYFSEFLVKTFVPRAVKRIKTKVF